MKDSCGLCYGINKFLEQQFGENIDYTEGLDAIYINYHTKKTYSLKNEYMKKIIKFIDDIKPTVKKNIFLTIINVINSNINDITTFVQNY